MKITGMKTCHEAHPLGFDFGQALLSWRVEESQGQKQTASRVEVALAPDGAPVYDSGMLVSRWQGTELLEGMDSAGWTLPMELAPRTRYYWRVTVLTDAEEQATSEWSWFETPKGKDEPWQAAWVTSPFGREVRPVFRKTFHVTEKPVWARCYIVGLGLFEPSLNGKVIGEEVLRPGFHAYDSRVMYQTLELQPEAGDNVFDVMLGEGWYMGNYGLKRSTPHYGTEYKLLAELHLKYADGREEIIGTDESWQVTRSTVLTESIYDGETQDPNQPAGEPEAALLTSAPAVPLQPRSNPEILVHEHFTPTVLATDDTVLDMGQNFAGWCGFWCDAPKGTEIRLLYGEHVLNGTIYRDNLRTAKCIFRYISDGTPRFVQPHFTYFGFRYVKVEGWVGKLDPSKFVGCAVYSDIEETGTLETSDPLLNRLYLNSKWSLKSNFLDIPTDCPQRDERMGWTGDIQIFCDTACYHEDAASFLRKFMEDLRCEQKLLNGSVPCVVPMCKYELNGVSAWGDAACVIPWQLYLHYGDKALLKQEYPTMKDWVDWIARENERHHCGYIWAGNAQLGDWLALDGDSVYGGTDRIYVATACYYYSASLTAKAAKVLGMTEDAAKYESLSQHIREAFQAEYFTPAGRIAIETQTACVMALGMGLVPDHAKEKTQHMLVKLIEENGFQLRTGFVGTPWLLPVLCGSGRVDLAYTLLLRRTYPGWLYEVENGATTIWERWNSIEPDGSMNKDGMNSLNHYAYGSIAAWMYRSMAGIQADHPGGRYMEIAPLPDPRVRGCKASYVSPCGTWHTAWTWDGDVWSLDVHVPFGCEALLKLPDGSSTRLMPGDHHASVTMPRACYTLDAPLSALVQYEPTRQVLQEKFPRALRGVAFQYEMHSLRQLLSSPFSEVTDEEIQELEDALKKIPVHYDL